MRPIHPLGIVLMLLSPVAVLAAYQWQRSQVDRPNPAATDRPSLNQSAPDLDSSSRLKPNPNSFRTAVPSRSLTLPPADYLPPIRSTSTTSSAPHSNWFKRTPVVHSSKGLSEKQLMGNVVSSPPLGLADPQLTSLTQPSILTGIARSPQQQPFSPSHSSMPTRTVSLPPSVSTLSMVQPLDLDSQSPGNAGMSPAAIATQPLSVLNNSTSLAFAEDGTDPIRQDLLIEPVRTSPYRQQRVIGAPASTLSTPTGFGASWGRVYAGVSLVNRARFNNDADGSATIGFGLGNPRRFLGLEVATNIISLSDSGGRDSFAGSGSVDFKVHRILPGEVGLAVGWENALAWGDARARDSSVYGVVSRAFPLQPNNLRNPMPLILSVGVGGGRFRSEDAIRNREGGVGVFASAGLRLTPQFSLLANWTGQDLNAGVSFIPFPEIPFSLTLGAVDLTGSAGDGARFGLSLGYGTRFNF